MEPVINSGKVLVRLSGVGGDGFHMEITPLTLATRHALLRKSIALYPDPDPATFAQSRTALGLAPAFGDETNDALSGEENPAYREALAAVERQRGQWVTDTAVDLCVASEHRDAYLTLYAGDRARLRELGLSEHLLPWPEVLHHFLAHENEWPIVIQTINGQMPLTEGEVIGGMSYFRVDIQRHVRQRFAAQARSHGTAPSESDTAESANGRDGGGAGVGLPDGDHGQPVAELVGGLAG